MDATVEVLRGTGSMRALARESGGHNLGRLKAMSCYRGSQHVEDLSQATRPGTKYKVRWVDVPDRVAHTTSVRMQFTDNQVTRSRKLEGAWWGDGGAYFVASFAREDDGSVNEHDGQVWFYDPKSQTVTLKTIFGVNPDPDQDTKYDGPDNITVSPYGGVILAEDGDSEFTGPNFSADGQILFANIQSPGHVFAITGPWRRPSNGHG